jgi:hypothetical protein
MKTIEELEAELETVKRERDAARSKLRMCADSLQDLLKEYAKVYDEMERARASELALMRKP